MEIMTAFKTDKGNVKAVNQDGLLIKTAETKRGSIAMLSVCDGVGGLSEGERASSYVLFMLSQWFENRLPIVLTRENMAQTIRQEWNELLKKAGRELFAYARNKGIKLGTTCTVLLLLPETYYVAHVGDTRLYEITRSLRQVTQDQTLLAREISLGRVTEQEAVSDARGSILLQAVGATEQLEPVFLMGKTQTEAVYMLCSDGFRHKVSEAELYEAFAPQKLYDEQQLEAQCEEMVHLVMSREERDNITVAVAKTWQKQ